MKTISGDTPLTAILARTELTVHPAEFMLVGLNPVERGQIETQLSGLTGELWQYIVEPDVLTLLLNCHDWTRLASAYPQAQVTGPLRLFSFSVAMDWDVVGFLAAVTGLLAGAGVPLGAVCGYYRDHLFIAVEHAARAEAVLRSEIDRLKESDKE
jgi:hypothetical protein